MVKDKDIKQFMLRHQPEVKNSGPFMKDVVRQINAMPIPAAMNPERQKMSAISAEIRSRIPETAFLSARQTGRVNLWPVHPLHCATAAVSR